MLVHLSILCMSCQVNTTSNSVVLTKKASLRIRFLLIVFCFLAFECEQLVFLFYVFPVMLVSRNPAVFYDFDLGFMACGH